MSRLLPLLAFIALALLLFVGVRMNSGKDTSAIPSPLIGKTAPALQLPELALPESRIGVAELKGRAHVLNVWGSWCVSCRVEHPVITELARSGAVVVGYNYKDTPEDAARWLARYGNPFALVVQDQDGTAALDWGIYGAPETFVIDASGVVRFKHIGPLTPEIVSAHILPILQEAP
ncbi:DsbE family thiol:disulfide interchange protein [Arenimonas sp. GDDSR-1]|uniref:DsbE family thiol:disulfide interchange protein n=1 Tax=Arenimonas sp. GDDSR-1 TaxID=2950125 RepID=UPI00260573D6|nr:DsbE family thiol:disulfide interchange protein [Arenimonas sp. GDDSR-1]